eukprot:Skav231517  [mRNA]  locus=scaffold84:579883:581768:+ [translate_table: standard]
MAGRAVARPAAGCSAPCGRGATAARPPRGGSRCRDRGQARATDGGTGLEPHRALVPTKALRLRDLRIGAGHGTGELQIRGAVAADPRRPGRRQRAAHRGGGTEAPPVADPVVKEDLCRIFSDFYRKFMAFFVEFVLLQSSITWLTIRHHHHIHGSIFTKNGSAPDERLTTLRSRIQRGDLGHQCLERERELRKARRKTENGELLRYGVMGSATGWIPSLDTLVGSATGWIRLQGRSA